MKGVIRMHKEFFRFQYAMNYVFQVTVSMLTPAAIWIGLGLLLNRRWGVGKWALILCILIGVFSGCYSMFRFLMTTTRMIDPTAEDKKEDEPHDPV